MPTGRAGPGLSEYLRTSGFSTLLFILTIRRVELAGTLILTVSKKAKRKDLVGSRLSEGYFFAQPFRLQVTASGFLVDVICSLPQRWYPQAGRSLSFVPVIR